MLIGAHMFAQERWVWPHQAGKDFPLGDLQQKPKNNSWGVALVAVRNSDRVACEASGNTVSQDSA